MTESAGALGLTLEHERPVFDAKLRNMMPWINVAGASVAAADFNNDGFVDLYVTNSARGTKNALYQNRGDGTFADVAAQAGVADENRPEHGASMGGVWGDYDNDGCQDLFLYKWGRNELFRNNCDGTFTRVTDQAGLGTWAYAGKAIWIDVNRDGCSDVYIANYWRPEHDLWRLTTTRILNDDAERSRNGGPNTLWINRCDGTFTESARQFRVDDTGWSWVAGSGDFNDDGWPDIYLANDFGPDMLYLNEAGRGFRKVKAFRGIGDDTFKGMNVDVGDYDNDGRLDIYVSNITKEGFLLEGNMLWRQSGNGQWENTAWKADAASCGWGWGAKFADLDLDGWPDIFATNGMRSTDNRTEGWFESGTMSSTPFSIFDDAANYPETGNRSISGHEPNCLFLNDKKGKFRNVAAAAGITDTLDGRGVAVVDLENDGTPDLVLANQSGPILAYRNTNTAGAHWLQLRLVGAAPSPRDAIGARVTVKAGGLTQTQEVSGGNSFAAQSDPRLLFGLGMAAKVDSVEIRWPDGRRQTLTDLAVDQLHTITQRR